MLKSEWDVIYSPRITIFLVSIEIYVNFSPWHRWKHAFQWIFVKKLALFFNTPITMLGCWMWKILIPIVPFFCSFLIASMALQIIWSFVLALLDAYALLKKKVLLNPVLISLFVVGDWVSLWIKFYTFPNWFDRCNRTCWLWSLSL